MADPIAAAVPSAHAGAERARNISLVLLIALGAISTLAAFTGERSTVSFGLVVFFLVAPLALPLPGMVQRQRRTFAWATLCVTPHFIYALTEIVANPAIRTLSATMLVLSLGLATALVAYVRLTRSSG